MIHGLFGVAGPVECEPRLSNHDVIDIKDRERQEYVYNLRPQCTSRDIVFDIPKPTGFFDVQ